MSNGIYLNSLTYSISYTLSYEEDDSESSEPKMDPRMVDDTFESFSLLPFLGPMFEEGLRK